MIIIVGNFIKCWCRVSFIHFRSVRNEHLSYSILESEQQTIITIMIMLLCRFCPLYAAFQQILWSYIFFFWKNKETPMNTNWHWSSTNRISINFHHWSRKPANLCQKEKYECIDSNQLIWSNINQSLLFCLIQYWNQKLFSIWKQIVRDTELHENVMRTRCSCFRWI